MYSPFLRCSWLRPCKGDAHPRPDPCPSPPVDSLSWALNPSRWPLAYWVPKTMIFRLCNYKNNVFCRLVDISAQTFPVVAKSASPRHRHPLRHVRGHKLRDCVARGVLRTIPKYGASTSSYSRTQWTLTVKRPNNVTLYSVLAFRLLSQRRLFSNNLLATWRHTTGVKKKYPRCICF